MIRRHTMFLDSTPGIFEAIDGEGTHNGGEEFPGIVVVEYESIPFTCERIIFLHSISQATNMAHDGHAPIAHRDHLAQSTSCKTGRHEKHVAASINTLCQFSIKGQEDGNLLGMTCGQVL